MTRLISSGFHSPIYNQVNHQRHRHASVRQRVAQLHSLAARMTNKSKPLTAAAAASQPSQLLLLASEPPPQQSFANYFYETLTYHFNQLLGQLLLQVEFNAAYFPSTTRSNDGDLATLDFSDDQFYYFLNTDASSAISSSFSCSPNLLFLVCLLIALLESVVSRWIGQAKQGLLSSLSHFFRILIKCKCLKILVSARFWWFINNRGVLFSLLLRIFLLFCVLFKQFFLRSSLFRRSAEDEELIRMNTFLFCSTFLVLQLLMEINSRLLIFQLCFAVYNNKW